MASQNPYLTITLTGRPPVKIKKEDWPVIAQASDNDRHGAQIGNEPNKEDTWTLKVRQHEDGRTIVYGTYSYDTHYQGDSLHDIRGGELLDPNCDVVEAIQRVASDLADRLNAEDLPGNTFARLAHQCIADLPAVEI